MIGNLRNTPMSLAGHVTFSRGELWLLIWGFASVIAFTSLDDVADDVLTEAPRTVARLAIITALVIADRFMVMRAYRRELKRTLRMVPAIRLLTARERQVMGLMARGMTPHEIAVLLFVQPPVVDHAIRSIMDKLQLRHRSQLVQWLADEDELSE